MTEETEQKSVAEKAPEKKRRMSIGEKVFDTTVYGFMNYIGTFILTIPLADSLEFGLFKKPYAGAVKGLMNLGLKEDVARIVTRVTTTMQGGNVMVFPIKWAENHKVSLVTKINHAFGDKSDPKDIEEKPKQTWGNLVFSRIFLAWLPVFICFFGANLLFPKVFKDYEEWVGKGVANYFKQPTHINGEPTRAYRYGILAAWDVYATACAVTLLYLGSHIWHPPKKKGESKDTTPAPERHAPVPELAKEKAELPKLKEQPEKPTPALAKEKLELPKLKEQPEKPRAEVIANSVSKESAQQAVPTLTA